MNLNLKRLSLADARLEIFAKTKADLKAQLLELMELRERVRDAELSVNLQREARTLGSPRKLSPPHQPSVHREPTPVISTFFVLGDAAYSVSRRPRCIGECDTLSFDEQVNVLNRLKRRMSELEALRKAVTRAEQSHLMAMGSRELSAYPEVIDLPAFLQLSQKPVRLFSSPCPSLRRSKRIPKLRKHRRIRTSRPLM